MSNPMTTEAPHVLCPKCDTLIYAEDYYEMGKGSEMECPKCDTLLMCTCEESEMVTRWTWDLYKDAQHPTPSVDVCSSSSDPSP